MNPRTAFEQALRQKNAFWTDETAAVDTYIVENAKWRGSFDWDVDSFDEAYFEVTIPYELVEAAMSSITEREDFSHSEIEKFIAQSAKDGWDNDLKDAAYKYADWSESILDADCKIEVKKYTVRINGKKNVYLKADCYVSGCSAYRGRHYGKVSLMDPRKAFEQVLLTERVASRYAMEFPTEEAKAKYLKEHPDADKSKHTVKKDDKEDDGLPPEKGPSMKVTPKEISSELDFHAKGIKLLGKTTREWLGKLKSSINSGTAKPSDVDDLLEDLDFDLGRKKMKNDSTSKSDAKKIEKLMTHLESVKKYLSEKEG